MLRILILALNRLRSNHMTIANSRTFRRQYANCVFFPCIATSMMHKLPSQFRYYGDAVLDSLIFHVPAKTFN